MLDKFKQERTVVVSVTRKNTGTTHIDRYNPNSTVSDQVIAELEKYGDIVQRVIIDTANSTYVVSYDD